MPYVLANEYIVQRKFTFEGTLYNPGDNIAGTDLARIRSASVLLSARYVIPVPDPHSRRTKPQHPTPTAMPATVRNRINNPPARSTKRDKEKEMSDVDPIEEPPPAPEPNPSNVTQLDAAPPSLDPTKDLQEQIQESDEERYGTPEERRGDEEDDTHGEVPTGRKETRSHEEDDYDPTHGDVPTGREGDDKRTDKDDDEDVPDDEKPAARRRNRKP